MSSTDSFPSMLSSAVPCFVYQSDFDRLIFNRIPTNRYPAQCLMGFVYQKRGFIKFPLTDNDFQPLCAGLDTVDFRDVGAIQVRIDGQAQHIDGLDFVINSIRYGCCLHDDECDDKK
eukprot:TRINITY_DN519_c0_g1_i1.p1 TRINITY_DN519_c0_g1~~TRINITY_DN519_c0_g1_i1.p1  ORF type:complete len:117 (+),score=11.81 TRINITY_DN519_c0_g1_i1:173-523(+)